MLLTEVRTLPSGYLLPSQLQLEQRKEQDVLEQDKKKKEDEEDKQSSLLDENVQVEEVEDIVADDGDNEIIEKLSAIEDESKVKELRDAFGKCYLHICYV